ncbi:MAG: hypothetical protein RIB60_04175 [Phycisphaerales bacterium]
MGEVKPWQAVLFVLAILVVGGGIVWMVVGGSKIRTPDRIYMIDIGTGDLYYADVSGRRGIAIPALHPETRERTLIPITQDDEGSWRVRDVYAPAIESMQVTPASVIDTGSWIVQDVRTGSATKYRSPLLDG